MTKQNIDPRVSRTHQLIYDAFLSLSKRQDFQEITVIQISQAAGINRSTFYSHFADKYDLLEQIISDRLHFNLNCSIKKESLSIEDTIKEVFLALAHFQLSLSDYCRTLEEQEVFYRILKINLSQIFSTVVSSHNETVDSLTLSRVTSLFTSGIISMSEDWINNQKEVNPETYVDSLLPFLLNGLNQLKTL